MKLMIKGLNGTQFDVEVSMDMKVSQIKEKISETRGAGWETERQKLILKGKVLADDSLLSEYKVQENDFLVCFLAKLKAPESKAPAAPAQTTPADTANAPPAAPQPATTTTTPSPAAAAAAPVAPPTAPAAPAPQVSQTAAPTPSSVAPAGTDVGVTDAAIAQLQEMGFPREECVAALRAAFGDTTRAVDFLMNGIPPQAAAAAAAATSGAPTTSSTPGNPGSTDPFASLRQNPRLNEMRRSVQENPNVMPQIVQMLCSNNPQLLEAINSNGAAFVELMNEPVEGDEQENEGDVDMTEASPFAGGSTEQFEALLQAMQQMRPEERAQLAQSMGVPADQLLAITQMMQSMSPQAMTQMMSMMQGGMADTTTVTLTQEEAAAVERLTELGFPREACIEAYFICDKNENLAADYLFNNPPDGN